MIDSPRERVRKGHLIEGLLQHPGWSIYEDWIGERIDATKEKMTEGLEQTEYLQAVGAVAAYRRMLIKPKEFIQQGMDARRQIENE